MTIPKIVLSNYQKICNNISNNNLRLKNTFTLLQYIFVTKYNLNGYIQLVCSLGTNDKHISN